MKSVNKVGIIVGNGVTRKLIDLDNLVGKGTIFGCNALYRDFDKWDYLVSIDQGMINEIRNSEGLFGNGQVIVPPLHEQFESPEYSPMTRRSNAGMNAMMEAIKKDCNVLYCLGFDFLLNGEVSTDNVYKNTENYGPETHANQNDNFYRAKYLEWYANQNSDTQFVFVFPEDTLKKDLDCDNVYYMGTHTFIKKLNS
jgi:hypothetical protein